MVLPSVVRDPGLPERVTIYEVGARDGLQNEAALVPTEVKAELIRRLLAAGLPIVEATSFVHPKWVPQLADAEELLALLGDEGRDLPGAGAQRARPRPGPGPRLPARRDLRQRHPDLRRRRTSTAAWRSSSPSSSRPYDARATPVSTSGPTCRCASATRGRAPYPIDQVVRVGKRLFDLGASQLSIGDTIGVGTAGHVTALHRGVRRGRDGHRPAGDALPRHLRAGAGQHPGRAAARVSPPSTPAPAASGAAPTPSRATGNLATEDLVWMLTGLGIEHGVDLDALVATSAWLAGHLGRPSPSAVVRALAALDPSP